MLNKKKFAASTIVQTVFYIFSSEFFQEIIAYFVIKERGLSTLTGGISNESTGKILYAGNTKYRFR